jgi:hypothetical protein
MKSVFSIPSSRRGFSSLDPSGDAPLGTGSWNIARKKSEFSTKESRGTLNKLPSTYTPKSIINHLLQLEKDLQGISLQRNKNNRALK